MHSQIRNLSCHFAGEERKLRDQRCHPRGFGEWRRGKPKGIHYSEFLYVRETTLRVLPRRQRANPANSTIKARDTSRVDGKVIALGNTRALEIRLPMVGNGIAKNHIEWARPQGNNSTTRCSQYRREIEHCASRSSVSLPHHNTIPPIQPGH